jgi:hypothetical protein
VALLRKYNEKLAGMYTTSYKEPSVDDLLKKLNNIRIDNSTSELAIETSKGVLILGCEVDNGDAIIVKGFI